MPLGSICGATRSHREPRATPDNDYGTIARRRTACSTVPYCDVMGYRTVYRGLGATTAVVALSVGLLGCGSTGTNAPVASSAPSATAKQTPTPEPTETRAAAVADRVHVTAEALSVLDADGVQLVFYDYRQRTADVVAGLSAYLGDPEVERIPSSTHSGEGSRYVWDSLSISSEDRWAELTEAELPTSLSRWSVRATGPSARGATVDTIDGVRVGDSTEDVLSAHPDSSERLDMSSVTPRTDIYLGAVLPPIPEDDPEYRPEYRWRVWLFDEDPTDVVQDLRAPSPNYGP